DVFGARLTGAGFGGCVVALTRPGTDLSTVKSDAWLVQAGDGARLL
ncbi:MAG: galactokinase, partial [Candidatus Microthrix parvicella]|nr:galactokinase [Candidatus Microthrix parvicella]